LDFCKKDGKEMYEFLKSKGYELPFNRENETTHEVELIGEVEGQKMNDSVIDFFRDPSIYTKDTLLFYFSGHGVPDGQDVYLASSEINTIAPSKRGFSFDALTKTINLSRSEKIITILDCCHSGKASLEGKGGNKGDSAATVAAGSIDGTSAILEQGHGKCLLAASRADEEAYPLTEEGFSLFTYFLLQGLRGNELSVDNNGNVTAESLGKYVFASVMNRPQDKRPRQTPIRKIEAVGEIILTSYPELRRKPQPSPIDIDIIIAEGDDYYEKKDHVRAIECYDRAIKIQPNNVKAWYSKGLNLSSLREHGLAIECYDKAIALDPNHFRAWLNKGVSSGPWENTIRL